MTVKLGEAIACPECGLEIPADDLQAQVSHMKRDHPEVIERRLLCAGFRRGPDGSWVDMLASDY